MFIYLYIIEIGLHGFKSHTGLNFFSGPIFTTAQVMFYCQDHFHINNEESNSDETKDCITEETQGKLIRNVTKSLLRERNSLTNLKVKLDRGYYNSLTLHARAMS